MRFGVSLPGPFWVSFGGRRRRRRRSRARQRAHRHHTSSNYLTVLAVIVLAAAVVKFWYVAIPVAVIGGVWTLAVRARRRRPF